MAFAHALWTPVLLSVLVSSALAEPRYLDDRSSPDRLVQSLYNAINRHEYARAWSYFTAPPAKDFDTYVKGFDSTGTVEVLLGTATADGAAGSTYYNLPVALRAQPKEGQEKFFVGCYTLRLVGPSNQDPPFRAMSIEKGSLKPSAVEYMSPEVLKPCGDIPVDAKEALAEQATLRFEAEQKNDCRALDDYEDGPRKPDVYQLKWKYSYDEKDAPEKVTTLFSFPCNMGAYNSIEVYYVHDETDGLRQLTFAVPDIKYDYLDENSEKLKSWAFQGWMVQRSLVNSGFDEKTNTISQSSKWRGLGDASSNATWSFREGDFTLTDYNVDPTYDGEIEPFDVIKAGVPVK